MMNNYERIKAMTIEKMAKELSEQQCRECGYVDIGAEWKKCDQVDCWCHKNNRYRGFLVYLKSEVNDEY